MYNTQHMQYVYISNARLQQQLLSVQCSNKLSCYSLSCVHLLKSLSCLVPKPTRYPCIDKSYILIVYACNLLCRAKQSSYHSSIYTKLNHTTKKEEDLFGYISNHMSDKALAVAKGLRGACAEGGAWERGYVNKTRAERTAPELGH